MRSMRHEALWLGTIISGNDGISLFNISKALEAAESEKFHAPVASVLFSQGLKYIRYHYSFFTNGTEVMWLDASSRSSRVYMPHGTGVCNKRCKYDICPKHSHHVVSPRGLSRYRYNKKRLSHYAISSVIPSGVLSPTNFLGFLRTRLSPHAVNICISKPSCPQWPSLDLLVLCVRRCCAR